MSSNTVLRLRTGKLVAGFLLAAVLVLAVTPPTASAFDIFARIKSDRTKVRGNVTVVVEGEGLSAPLIRQTNPRGVAKFSGLEAGSYMVTPSKSGWRYIPASSLVVLGGETLVQTVGFTPRRLEAASSIGAEPSALTLPETAEATVTVTVLNALGRGLIGAPVSASSSNEAIAKVSPAQAVADSNGQAFFTVEAAGSIEFFAQAIQQLGGATITFTSGGWRGTAVRTATTEVTLETGNRAALWQTSGHSDAASEAFRHWDEDGEVEVRCAKCHSKPGFLDFIADGTVDNPAPTDTVIDCFLCHDPTAWSLSAVTFPSGAVIEGLGREAICMTCHQGRSSKPSVDSAVVGLPEDDVSSSLSFVNIHYFAAAASQFGTQVMGGYEYPGMFYDGRAPHVSSRNVCYECHDPHSLALEIRDCQTCHPGVIDYASVKDVRMAASTQDYNGNGVLNEGIAAEMEGLAARLYLAVQAYADTKGFPIAYTPDANPYFFNDTNGNGVVDPAEAVRDNRYNHWTPRLLKAGYNYQVYQKDPGGHGHNAKYHIQLLYDSLADLATQVPVDMTGLVRNDGTHFNTTSMAFRDWDDTGMVSSSCARCHSGEAGFRYYLANGYGSVTSQPSAYRFSCETCHTGEDFAGEAPRVYVEKVVFPGGTTIPNDPVNPDDSFICMTCHQGRQSKATVDTYVSGKPIDTVDSGMSFRNVHYAAAGGTLYGHQAMVGYEYAGQTYANKFNHWGLRSAQCAYCHELRPDNHTFEPRLAAVCYGCHTEIVGADIETIRLNRPYDYNGNGDTSELLADEMAGLAARLYEEIKAYAESHGGGIVYDSHEHPYFFRDFDLDGEPDLDIGGAPISYDGWTPRLMMAAFNYQFYQKEPGNWAHNTNYMAQLLIDSIADLGGDVSTYQRPQLLSY